MVVAVITGIMGVLINYAGFFKLKLPVQLLIAFPRLHVESFKFSLVI